MTKVVLDRDTLKSLGNLDEPVELCDQSGNTVGRILPKEDYEQLVCDWARTQLGEVEIERIRRESGDRFTEALLERLRSEQN